MSDEIEVSTREMLKRMQDGWSSLQAYLNSLTEEQMTVPKDDVGWTVKDHLVHLAAWEAGIAALLSGQDRWQQMEVDPDPGKADDNAINAVIQAKHKNKTLAEARKMLQDAHQRLVDGIQKLSDQDLLRPYRTFDHNSTSDRPFFASVVGNSYGHYEEHKPWIEAIVAKLK